MKTKRTLTIAALLVALAALMTLGLFHSTRSVKAGELTRLNSRYTTVPMAATFKTYKVRPSATDGNDAGTDCTQPPMPPGPGIGCEGDPRWVFKVDPDDGPISSAPDGNHVLYVPAGNGHETTGKLLVFLGGGNGETDKVNPGDVYARFYEAAVGQGYHVIGLSNLNLGPKEEAFMLEAVTGEESSNESTLSEHPQDSIINRLVRVLEWASIKHPEDGWGRYLTSTGEVDWAQVHLAGFSNGSSYASFVGTLNPMARLIGRVTLLSGPNDGKGNSEEEWIPADYIERRPGVTDTRYYGLVHRLNNDEPLYMVTKNWRTFGMEEPLNRRGFEFDPDPGITTMDFMSAHVLISTDEETPAADAHPSIPRGEYKNCDRGVDPNQCRIGYEPAWRCILGTGDAWASSTPTADAGPSQIVECQGSGGANVLLDGAGSRDPDCDVLTYTWTGSFGVAAGRNPTVFLSVGTHPVTLVVKDDWSSSNPTTVLITVRDTQPPSLQLTLTPTLLWPPNHRLVRINATVSAMDSCGGSPPQIVLTSITSNQPDNGGGDGDTAGDIQEAAFGTFDRSFLFRAERAGGDLRGRTYTVTYTATDASGNQTQASATVHVPHSRR